MLPAIFIYKPLRYFPGLHPGLLDYALSGLNKSALASPIILL